MTEKKASNFASTKGKFLRAKALKKSSKGERLVVSLLKVNNIKYVRGEVIDLTHSSKEECAGSLGSRDRRWGFLLYELNTVVEFDGKPHFVHVPYFHPQVEKFKEYQLTDIDKTVIAIKERKAKVIRLDYTLSDDALASHLEEALTKDCDLYVSNQALYAHLIQAVSKVIPNAKVATSEFKSISSLDALVKYQNSLELNYYFWKGKVLTVYIKTTLNSVISTLEDLGFKRAGYMMYTNKIDSENCRIVVSTLLDADKYEALLGIYESQLGAVVEP